MSNTNKTEFAKITAGTVFFILQKKNHLKGGITLKINDRTIKLESCFNLTQLLEKQGYNLQRIAVLLNNQVVSKEKFDHIVLKDTDTIEVVSFVGGG